ncbi:Uncharacterised protein [Mycobacteroides abscessus subsp. massiliense]|nr:Uncharacterised protein [Mycobacteroides abscessus subsp. massiliense]
MNGGQRGISNVVSGVVIVDRAVEPFAAVHPERSSSLHDGGRRNIGVPPVVPDDLLLGELLVRIQREQHLGHGIPSG